MKTGRPIPPCVQCHRNTPPLGETVCRKCQAAQDERDEQSEAHAQFYSYIDDVSDPAVQACLRALFRIAGGDEI